MTLPELRAASEREEAKLEGKQKAELERAAKKKPMTPSPCVHFVSTRRSQVVSSDCPLASYRRKDGLIALAGALARPVESTLVELMKAIKVQGPPCKISGHANEPRFSGLFPFVVLETGLPLWPVPPHHQLNHQYSMPPLPHSSTSQMMCLFKPPRVCFPLVKGRMFHAHIPYTSHMSQTPP